MTKKTLNNLSLIFIAFFVILIIFLPTNHLGTDIFYHYQFSSLLTNDLSLQTNFDRITYSITNEYPADLSYGYHLLFAPITLINNPLLAIKILSLILLLTLISSFYLIFKRLKFPAPSLWLLALIFGSTYLLERLTLTRPFILSMSLFIIFVFALLKKNAWLTLIISVLWSYFYIGWPMAIIIIFIYIISQIIIQKTFNFKLFSFTFIGLLGGLIIRTDFPNNLIMTFKQIYYTIGLKLIGPNLNIGVENNYFSFINFIDSSPVYFFLLLSSILCLPWVIKIINNKDHKQTLFFLYLLTFTLAIFTFLNQRLFEYFSIAILFLSANILHEFIVSKKSNQLYSWLTYLNTKLKQPAFILLITLGFVAFLLRPIFFISKQFNKSLPINAYQQTAVWLKNNTPKDSLIFNSSWDAFPRLFFYNQHNRYLTGLDPTFLYIYDSKLYWQWRNITKQNCVADYELIVSCPTELSSPQLIATTIKENFNSEYIWLDNSEIFDEFKKFLETNPEFFTLMIETDDSSVFKIIK